MFSWPTVWNSVIFGWVVQSQQLQFTLDTHLKQVSSGSGSSRVNCVECFGSKSDNITKESCRYSLSVCVIISEFNNGNGSEKIRPGQTNKIITSFVNKTTLYRWNSQADTILGMSASQLIPNLLLGNNMQIEKIPIWIHPVTINFDNITQNKWISWRG